MISIERLSVCYGTNTVLQNVSMQVAKGSITAIVGPSGCGKSSFLATLNRMTDLMPGARVTGQIVIDGVDIHDAKCLTTDLRRQVGMIFQKPNPFPMSIRRNMELGLREHGIRDQKELTTITTRVLQDVGLWDEVCDRMQHSALELSGGQQQRLCIARALALQPKVILLDEPCSSLDPIASARVESLIAALRDSYTVIIVTHNLAQAQRISDQIAVFWVRDGVGEVIEQGRTADVFRNPENETAAAYLAGMTG